LIWYWVGHATHNNIKDEIEKGEEGKKKKKEKKKKKTRWTVKVANCLNRVTNSWHSMAVVKYSVFGQIIIKKKLFIN